MAFVGAVRGVGGLEDNQRSLDLKWCIFHTILFDFFYRRGRGEWEGPQAPLKRRPWVIFLYTNILIIIKAFENGREFRLDCTYRIVRTYEG